MGKSEKGIIEINEEGGCRCVHLTRLDKVMFLNVYHGLMGIS